MQSRWLGISPFAAVATLALTLALSGCGGGGSGNGGSEMSISDKWQRFQAGNPTLRLSSSQIRQAYDSRSRSASHELNWSLAGPVGGEQSIVVEADPHEYEDTRLPPGGAVSFAPVMERDGVPVAETRVRIVAEDEDDGETYLTDVVIYGGWLDHTVFGATFFAACNVDEPECSGTSPVYAGGFTGGFTPFGVYPGTTPAGMGSATWTGVMVGMDSPRFENHAAALAWANEGLPDVYMGDARIVIEDLAAPDVDVSFTGIHNVTEGTRRRDMSWQGLSVENGLFGGGDSDEYIAGIFTGPRHQEVAGEFRRDCIQGGFGAKRR